MSKNNLFEELRSQVDLTLQPVKPLSPPWTRALYILPWATLVLAGVLMFFGRRPDMESLGFIHSWGLSLLQFSMAYFILIGALKEAMPDSGVRITEVFLYPALGFLLHLMITVLTYQRVASLLTGEILHWQEHLVCFLIITVAGLPAALLAIWLTGHGLPMRPWVAGILAGVGAGLFADAVWRLICPHSQPSHILPSHTAAVVVLTIIGLLLGTWWDRRRLRRWSAQHSE